MTFGTRRLLAAFLAGTLALAAQVPARAAEDAEVKDFLLDNGMEVVVIPDHRAPIVTHMVWYKIGSADEPPGKSGIAHFFEHLMFKATANHAAGEFDRAVSDIGGSNNAFTSYDYTAFHETVAPSALEQMMGFEADRMRNLILTDDVIKTERDVILEERRSRIDSNPQAVLDEEVDATLWQNQPYRIPVIGWMHEMEQLNRTDAKAFYDNYYRPNNAVLVVAGDVDPDAVKAMAERTYGKVARGPDLPPRIRPVEPEQNTKRTVTLADARVSVPSFSTQWVVPSYHTAKPGEAEALDLLAAILGGDNRSRLYQQLVVKQGIASEAGAFFQGTMLDATNFTVYGTPRGDAKLSDVEAAVDAEIARIVKDGVTDDELERAKTRYVRSMIFARDKQDDMANMYGSTLATGGNVKDVEEWPDRIRKVTAAEVKAAARYLVLDRSTTGYLLPQQQAGN
ncbi:insulinase family protein [Mesorhizobium sp. M1C.F.Ca.ET.193.01.1.1]|uniref:M16 family metallopeptidase n=1 Tax=unclassified Mesorhizobium TaxID=325217 RepID=UPI000FD5C110|nr:MULTISPECIES: pitrilysin family protein [unclassified Mesorhizobium]TGS96338.1 insulinase family protein [bacterium M00.F.Ca.ET.177.01.1.1]TGQ52121.1 insulinase family protein [Mesorhizobium sp. M1C.F.Ca.ET.210.01.1.1]TGQ68767.1 insulinase family protein [Mesorhizobium sp. M1C.F.Ca.ET.212.01.1.1]TGR04070.1 insulinase family protein [Mesorhizobium sp. M1C.F.Ca.ET.204.01.1.1]TGR24734.1 insulinase family protein [Mesorhizobium sp. M1C.F.Ca.ET.196.01.1.1]